MSNETAKSYAEAIKVVLLLDPNSQLKLISKIRRLNGLQGLNLEDISREIRETRFNKGVCCPHCSSGQSVRNGKQRGHQRYLCRNCGKSFSDHTNTPLRGIHDIDKFLLFIEHLVAGYSLRKSSGLLRIALSTAWWWRHKILTALKRLEVPCPEGITEVDETYFLSNEKGNRHIVGRKPRKRGSSASKRGLSFEQVCVVVARDRVGTTICQVAGQGQVSKAKAQALLNGKMDNVVTLCSDANGTWKSFANSTGLDHVELNLKRNRRVVKDIYHIQNVNAFHQRLKDWMRGFHGVASKYLDNYLTLFRFIDTHKGESISHNVLRIVLGACQTISPDRFADIRATQFSYPT